MKNYTQPSVEIVFLTLDEVFLYVSVEDNGLVNVNYNKGFEDIFG